MSEEALVLFAGTLGNALVCLDAHCAPVCHFIITDGRSRKRKSKGKGQRAKITNSQSPTPTPQAEAEAEACFLKAIEVARRQSAKSWELRATVSLTRVWQSQGKRKEAHKLLSEIYDWFTEGFDTKDLQEAKALLGELQR